MPPVAAARPRISCGHRLDAHVATCLTCPRGRGPDLFEAIGDATRRTVLDELTHRNGQTLFEICGRLTVEHGLASSSQAISRHLAMLEQAGHVHTRRQGCYTFHHIDTRPLRSIVERWPIDREEPNP